MRGVTPIGNSAYPAKQTAAGAQTTDGRDAQGENVTTGVYHAETGDKPLISVREVVDLLTSRGLDVSERQVYRLLAERTIPCERKGRSYRVNRADVVRWAESGSKVEPSTTDEVFAAAKAGAEAGVESALLRLLAGLQSERDAQKRLHCWWCGTRLAEAGGLCHRCDR